MDISRYRDRFPFISIAKFNSLKIYGVIEIQTKTAISIYDIEEIHEAGLLTEFMDVTKHWWSRSNRNIPISIFMTSDMDKFEKFKKTYQSKDLVKVYGHTVCLSNLRVRRIKRKTVQLKKRS